MAAEVMCGVVGKHFDKIFGVDPLQHGTQQRTVNPLKSTYGGLTVMIQLKKEVKQGARVCF